MEKMSLSILKVDMETLHQFQKELHQTKDEKEEITSNFVRVFRKTTYYSHIKDKLHATTIGDNLVFDANNTFDYLSYTELWQTIPALRVAKGFEDKIQIAWPHNLIHNAIAGITIKHDDDVTQTLDSVWFDIYSQFYMQPGFRDHYYMCVGNVKPLEEFSTFLPEYPTTFPVPAYYVKDQCLSIPLYLCSLSKVQHVVKMRNKISDLLRMQANKDGEWINISYNHKYVEGLGTGTLSPPEMWGRYVYLDETERNHGKCQQEHTFYIEDVVVCDGLNPSQYGNTTAVDIDCKTPCKSMFWVAENQEAKKFHNYSNYTTNTNHLYSGWNPIDSVSLYYSNSPRFKDMHSAHFDRMECFRHFPSPPCEPGYNGLSFSWNTMSLDAEPGIIFDGLKAKLIVKLANTDPFLKPVRNMEYTIDGKDIPVTVEELEAKEDAVSKKSSPLFILRARLLVTRKLTYRLDPSKKTYLISLDEITSETST